MARRFAVLVGLALAPLAIACSAGSDAQQGDTGGSSSGGVELKDSTLVATSSWEESAEVQSDRIVLPADADTANLVPGKVLVGGRSSNPTSKNPDGFLVKVKSVANQSGKVVVMTEPAALTDAVAAGTFALPVTALDFSDGAGTQTQSNGTITKKFHYALTPRTLYSFNEQVTGANGLAAVQGNVAVKEGHFDFTPTLSYSAEIKKALGFIPTGVDFKASAEGDLDASITVTADVLADAAGKLDASYSKTMGGQPVNLYMSPPKALPNVKLGPINVASSAQLKIDAICTLRSTNGEAHASAGAAVTGHALAGAEYDGSWKQSFDHTLTGTPSLTYSADGRFDGECRLNATVLVTLFGAATADVTLGSYVSIAAQGSVSNSQAPEATCSLKAGAQADFDGELQVLGFKVASKQFNIFKVEWSPDGCNDGTPATGGGDTDGGARSGGDDGGAGTGTGTDDDAYADQLCAKKPGTSGLFCGSQLGADDAHKNMRYECIDGQSYGFDTCTSCGVDANGGATCNQ